MTARLAALLDDVEVAEVIGGDPRDVEVSGVTQDSSAVAPGSLYCCIVGRTVDGHDLAPEVVRAGARSLLVERVVDVAVPQVKVASTRSAIAPVAAAFYGHPSARMDVVGVTGTNGKTTTTHLIVAILRTAGWSTGLLGTLSGARTTPEAPILQERLAEFLDDGCRAVAMEVSSMALDQHRADAIDFAVAVWTNLTQDHLDYHGDMDAYFAAKARLFEPQRCRAAVINGDDPWAARLDLSVPVTTYRLAEATGLTTSPAGSAFRWRGHPVDLSLGGIHNVANALAAASTCAVLGVEPAVIAAGLTSAPPVPGRWELIDGGQDFTVIVDYAHTPDGLEQVLGAARSAVGPGGRVIVVFGCGGDRDRAKRPLMTAAATALADVTVLTTDNPRSEDPAAILRDAVAGARPGAALVVEPDRDGAIGIAVDAARKGDLVVIAGKGHETGQVIGDQVLPFDDREAARVHLAARRGSWSPS
jgi:UDP-N-acetylmuramoyl-L-alanyl-D-glutamate--2,6-diaminopimelate ligase